MGSESRYFILNRCSDWQEKSFYENVNFVDDMMTSKKDSALNGVYISSAFDGEQLEISWNRLRLDMDLPQNSRVRLKVYSSDSLYQNIPNWSNINNGDIELNEYFLDPDVKTQDKIVLFDVLGAKTFENPTDICLYSFKGRYLWICIELINYGDEQTYIKKLKLEFPRISFVDYLPQIYRGGEKKDFFLARFIAMFQSIYLDLEDNIDDIPRMFDPDTVSDEILNWIAQWFSIKDVYIWGEDRLREFLKSAVSIYKMKGTKASIIKMIDIYLGVKPIIVEKFNISDNEYYQIEKNTIDNLFGENRYTFSVIIKTDKVIDSETYGALIKIIDSCKPIDAICNLVILNNEIYLDHHSYLGINSYTTKNQGMVLDDNSNTMETTLLVDNDKDL